MITKAVVKKELVEYCKKNNLSLKKMAENIGVYKTTFFNLEKRNLSDRTIGLLIKYWTKRANILYKLKNKE